VTQTSPRQLRVLVAEDTATGREVVRQHLEEKGLEVVFAEDGVVAVEHAKVGGFDVILMDLRMPRMDGFEAIKLIREHETASGLPRTPIVVISANSDSEDVQNSLKAGADAHIPKPVKRMDVVGAVMEFAQRD
jgi:two-component system, sensor histidine kinase